MAFGLFRDSFREVIQVLFRVVHLLMKCMAGNDNSKQIIENLQSVLEYKRAINI